VLVVGQTDRQRGHGNTSKHCSGVNTLTDGNFDSPRDTSRKLRVTMASACAATADSIRWLSASSGKFGRHAKYTSTHLHWLRKPSKTSIRSFSSKPRRLCHVAAVLSVHAPWALRSASNVAIASDRGAACRLDRRWADINLLEQFVRESLDLPRLGIELLLAVEQLLV
jgi:hypothetical protein